MSCSRLSWVLYTPCLRTLALRPLSTTAQSRKSSDQNDDGNDNQSEKVSKSVSDLMSALKGLKVDGISVKAESKKRLGFSAAAQFKKRKQEIKSTTEKKIVEPTDLKLGEVEELVKEAAVDVAKTFPDENKTQSELLKQLMRFNDATEAGAQGHATKDVSAILSGIKVQKESPVKAREETFTAASQGDRQVSFTFDRAFGDGAGHASAQRPDEGTSDGISDTSQRQSRRTLFDRQRLNIFQAIEDKVTRKESSVIQEEKSVWEIEADKQRKRFLSDTIRNGFDEMIQLTEEGKLWKYPIDNERGLDEEEKIPFHEHVFLDEHLEGFPNTPEIMNFMELVLIGLGKNPFLTVQQKKEHIDWFRNYFESKMETLKVSAATS